MRKKIAIFVCLFVVACLFATSASTVAKKPENPGGGKPGGGGGGEELGTEYQITDEPQGQLKPRVHGNIIVWSDQRDGDIWMYHLGSDGVPFTGDDDGEHMVVGDPEKAEEVGGIYGNILVYQRWDSSDPGNRNIYMYHLGEDSIPGTSDDSGPYQLTDYEGHEWGRIYGTVIVWRGEAGGAHDGIYALDLGPNEIPDEGENPVLLPDTEGNGGLQIYENKIIYNKNEDIYIYDFGADVNDLTDDTPIRLEKPFVQEWAFMYEDSLVWRDNRNGNWYIYYGEPGPDGQWGTADDVERQITNPRRENDDRPRIYGDKIVWPRNLRNKNSEKNNIYMYDLSTDEEHKITSSDTSDYCWLFEDHIVYHDSRNGNLDTFLFILS